MRRVYGLGIYELDGHAVANPSKPENSGEATRRTRTIKPMALTIEQLDAFMSRGFTDV